MLGALVLLACAWRLATVSWVNVDMAPPARYQFLVDVNQATWPEFAQLPGVGETLAKRIVLEREHRGPYTTVQGLRQVRGIGPARFAKIAPYLAIELAQAGQDPSSGGQDR